PTPALIHLTARASGAVKDGVSTADGWQLSFERLLVGLGSASLEGSAGGSACVSYADARYDRLFDFAALGAPQKLSEVYGLGACSLWFRLRSPSTDALLEQGV